MSIIENSIESYYFFMENSLEKENCKFEIKFTEIISY